MNLADKSVQVGVLRFRNREVGKRDVYGGGSTNALCERSGAVIRAIEIDTEIATAGRLETRPWTVPTR